MSELRSFDWCDVHQAMIPGGDMEPLPHCYEWWMREVAGDDVESLEDECIVIKGRLIDRKAIDNAATCEHTEAEIREMAYQVWVKDQARLITEAVKAEDEFQWLTP